MNLLRTFPETSFALTQNFLPSLFFILMNFKLNSCTSHRENCKNEHQHRRQIEQTSKFSNKLEKAARKPQKDFLWNKKIFSCYAWNFATDFNSIREDYDQLYAKLWIENAAKGKVSKKIQIFFFNYIFPSQLFSLSRAQKSILKANLLLLHERMQIAWEKKPFRSFYLLRFLCKSHFMWKNLWQTFSGIFLQHEWSERECHGVLYVNSRAAMVHGMIVSYVFDFNAGSGEKMWRDMRLGLEFVRFL